jgi:hypothetical protein
VILFNSLARESIVGSLRTQFMAAPGHAIFWAAILSYAAIRLPHRWRVWLPRLLIGCAVAFSTVNAWTAQERRVANPHTRYSHMVTLVESLAARMPGIDPDSLIGFVPVEGLTYSPVGWSYGLAELMRYLYGVPGYLVGIRDQFGVGYTLGTAQTNYAEAIQGFPAEQWVLFNVAANGTTTLLTEVPGYLDIPIDEAARYDPLRLIDQDAAPRPGLRYFVYDQSVTP